MKPGEVVYQGKTKKGRDIVISHLKRENIPGILKYFNEISKEQTYIRFQGEQLTLEEESKYIDDFLKKMEQGEAVKLLAYHNNNVVGVADITLQDKTFHHVGTFGITVAKEYRGEGIGKLLMNFTIQEAKKNMPSLKIIQLGVFGNNGIACSMYERLGFTRFGVLPKGVKHKGEFVDHFFMYKNV